MGTLIVIGCAGSALNLWGARYHKLGGLRLSAFVAVGGG